MIGVYLDHFEHTGSACGNPNSNWNSSVTCLSLVASQPICSSFLEKSWSFGLAETGKMLRLESPCSNSGENLSI